MNETMKTILNRRSIRAYKPEQIKEEELQTILEGGIYAPTAINEQPWHITVVQNEDLLNRINMSCKEMMQKSGNPAFAERAKNESFSVFYNAPTFIIISGNPKAITPEIDCALALENMFLAAESLNIGSCWIHAVTQLFSTEEGKSLKQELGIPAEYNTYSAGAFGYKAMEATAPTRKENIINIIR